MLSNIPKSIKLTVLVFIPLLLGAFIYIVYGVSTLRVFRWLEDVNLLKVTYVVRGSLNNYEIPEWFLHNLPDFLC
jgi:hypothetical protein